MIGDISNNLFASLPDATSVLEQERPFTSPNSAKAEMSTSIASAFIGGHPEDNTDMFAQMLMGNSAADQTPVPYYEGTADLAHEPESNQEAPTNTTAVQEALPVFDLAERANRKDQEDLLALQLQLQQHTSELAALVAQAKAQSPHAVQEQEKFLREETAGIGIYYVAVAQRLAISVKRAIKSMITIATSSASYGYSWGDTRAEHDRKRQEQNMGAQAAG